MSSETNSVVPVSSPTVESVTVPPTEPALVEPTVPTPPEAIQTEGTAPIESVHAESVAPSPPESAPSPKEIEDIEMVDAAPVEKIGATAPDPAASDVTVSMQTPSCSASSPVDPKPAVLENPIPGATVKEVSTPEALAPAPPADGLSLETPALDPPVAAVPNASNATPLEPLTAPAVPASAPVSETPPAQPSEPSLVAAPSGAPNPSGDTNQAPAPPAVPPPGPLSTLPPPPANDVRNLSIRAYLDQTVVPLLLEGMSEMVKLRPDDPVDWLADYLVRSNPSRSGPQNAGAGAEKRG